MNEEDGINTRTAELELLINGDATLTKKTLESHDIAVTVPEPTRFLVEAGAVIGIAAGVVNLTKALIELSRELRRTVPAPQVVARSLSGKPLLINEADEDKISSFVEAASGETED
jgi:hypothetical protein